MTDSLADLVDRVRALAEGRGRTLIGIVGAPGAGKSTVSTAILTALGEGAAVVGMDGFHLADQELVRRGRRNRKGAPDTFDVEGFVCLLQRLRDRQDGIVYAPAFDRAGEVSLAGAIPVPASTAVVITEGNYLLLDEAGWSGVRRWLDEVWFLDVPADLRTKRLVARRRSSGESLDQAQAWVRRVDDANAAIVAATRDRADLVIRLD